MDATLGFKPFAATSVKGRRDLAGKRPPPHRFAMNRFLNRIELIFLALLALSAVIVFVTQTLWITPDRKCEAAGDWWDGQTRTCGHVVYLPDITHRPIGGAPVAGPASAALYPDLPKTRADAAQAASAPYPAAVRKPH